MLIGHIRRYASLILLASWALPLRLDAAPIALELSVQPGELRECQGTEVEVSFSVRNPDSVDIAGLQIFLRYPAALFEPLGYRPRDLGGFFGDNGPRPFGAGYEGCVPAPSDPWDDGQGQDVVSVAAVAYASGEADGPVRAASATLGAFAFRMRPGAAAPAQPAVFSLEFDSCGEMLQQGNGLYDPEGRSLPLEFRRAQVSVRIAPGVKIGALSCTKTEGGGVRLSWTPPQVTFDGLNVYRDGEQIRSQVLPSVHEIVDASPPGPRHTYEVAAIVNRNEDPCRVSCAIELSPGATFIRGDVTRDGVVDISDPVLLLNHLFLSDSIECPDAADFDDGGSLDISDPVNLLANLFQAGPPPAAPFPTAGPDPTQDTLDC